MRARLLFTITTLALLCGCSSDDKPNAEEGGGATGGATGGAGNGGRPQGNAGRPSNFGGGPMQMGPVSAGAECPSDLGFSQVLALPNVKGVVDGSNVRITFDPAADARDYRVYVLPSADQVEGDKVRDAVYRCAGNYAVPYPAVDEATEPANPGVRTRADSPVRGIMRTAEDARLGYVFSTPGEGRVPVYALGNPNVKADNIGCYHMRWPETRVKRYTTSESERTELLGQHWRDDGIVFYAPEPGTAGTEPVFVAQESPWEYTATFYVTSGAEYDARAADERSESIAEAFSVFSDTQEGAEPLMRVFYDQACGFGHDELALGMARFFKAYQQGAQPVPELHFSGITEETTLVVEALDDLCPFQGVLAPSSRPARVDVQAGGSVDYPAFMTPEELADSSPTGELFVGGHGTGTDPGVISRACLSVEPGEQPEVDFRYNGEPETFTDAVQTTFQSWEFDSPTFNVQLISVATDEWSIGSMFGELWATYSDWAADTNGKLRITPKQRATLAADSFVHATMEVDTVTSQRRYPQLLISTADWPIQENLEKGSTVIVQTFGGVDGPMELHLEFCDMRGWDVNNQCPRWDLYKIKADGEDIVSPAPEINGFNGVDRTLRFDAYVSTERVYVYTNGIPYGCADLPAGRMSAGAATVTFGDVLYHSGADLAPWYPFHVEHMHVHTSRHFSNLAFSSNVPAPGWDETRLPCVPASGLQ